MAARPKVYLAGPEVFLPDAVAVGEAKKAICARHGLDGLFPFDNEARPVPGGPPVDVLIYRGNVGMMKACDAAILNLTPFRGAGADGGTAFELGFLTALGKPCVGYASDPDDYIGRVRRMGPVSHDPATGYWRDADWLSVEDFGNADNIMLETALEEGGTPLLRWDPSRSGHPLEDLAPFELCVVALAERLGTLRFA